jgi:hypothetical protein
MFADVVEVQVIKHGRLRVRFTDGTTGTVDMADTHFTGVFGPLRDPATFAQVRVSDGFVSWPGEVDLAPDAMYAAIRRDGVWRLG